jgi:hypothetical protein
MFAMRSILSLQLLQVSILSDFFGFAAVSAQSHSKAVKPHSVFLKNISILPRSRKDSTAEASARIRALR